MYPHKVKSKENINGNYPADFYCSWKYAFSIYMCMYEYVYINYCLTHTHSSLLYIIIKAYIFHTKIEISKGS